MHSHVHLLATSFATLLLICGCQASNKSTVASTLGAEVIEAQMLEALKKPGVIVFQKNTAAHWQVPLSGLLNLDHPKAKAAGLEDREEPIDIYTYSLVHPTAGTFLVDSGVSESFKHAQANPDIGTLVNAVMHFDELKVVNTTRDIGNALAGIDGVFLTHLHMDHILGLTDLDKNVPVVAGPGESTLQTLLNAFTQGTTNRLLKRQEKLEEWHFGESGILDVFGDGSLFAIHAPGHTPGTTAYVANTITGVHMMLGDVTHTKWGWDNNVEPGTFSHQPAESAQALARLKALASAIGDIHVHPGHQPL